MFSVVYLGRLQPGIRKHEASSGLKQYFRLTDQQAQGLLKGRRILKKSVARNDAQKIHQVCSSIGLCTKVIPDQKVTFSKVRDSYELEDNLSTIELESTSTEPFNRSVRHHHRSIVGEDIDRLSQAIIPIRSVSFKYGLGLAGVAMMALFIPLLYVLLIIVNLGAIFLFLPLGFEWSFFQNWHSILCIPISLLLLSLSSLLRPLFLKRNMIEGVALNRSKHKYFFEVVDALCSALKLNPPKKIIVNSGANAFVQPIGGVWGILNQNYALTVGMPLFSALSKKRLFGILGHEFGHCTQKIAMLANYLIRSVNAWMAKSVMEEDPWDERLKRRGQESQWLTVKVFCWLLHFVFSSSRFALNALLTLNLRLTAFMSQQMEFDADYYESIVIGSANFRKTAILLRQLVHSEKSILAMNKDVLRDGRLLENLPEAIDFYSKILPESVLDNILMSMEQEIASIWSSHPADADRITLVETYSHPGILVDSTPAKELLSNYHSLCCQVTLNYYKKVGITNPELRITRNENILEISLEKGVSAQAIKEYFGGMYKGRILNFSLPFDAEITRWNLNQCVDVIRHSLIEYKKNSEQRSQWLVRIKDILVLRCQNEEVQDIHFNSATPHELTFKSVDEAMAYSKKQLSAIDDKLSFIDNVFLRRIMVAVTSMDKFQADQAMDLLHWLLDARKMTDAYEKLKNFNDVLTLLISPREDIWTKQEEITEQFKCYCIEEINRLIRLAEVMPTLQNIDHQKRSLKQSINCWGGKTLEDIYTLTPHYVQEQGETLLQALTYQYYRVLSRLCFICLEYEKSIGAKPLKLIQLG